MQPSPPFCPSLPPSLPPSFPHMASPPHTTPSPPYDCSPSLLDFRFKPDYEAAAPLYERAAVIYKVWGTVECALRRRRPCMSGPLSSIRCTSVSSLSMSTSAPIPSFLLLLCSK